MKEVSLNIIFLILPIICLAQWQPGDVPLTTSWSSSVYPNNVHKEYPRPQLERELWKNLNGLWQFEFSQASEVPWDRILDDTILVPFPIESALSGIMKNATNKGIWYKTNFTIPSDWTEKRVLLHFGAVDWYTKVYLNEQELGEHKGGYDSFTFDITNILNENNDNDLILNVYDPSNHGNQACGKQWEYPEGIWFTAVTGVWQTVWLEAVPEVYIDDLKITPDVDNKNVKLDVSLNENSIVLITAQIIDGGEVISSQQRTGQGELEIPITSPKLWSPNDPFLYDLEVVLNTITGEEDSVKSYFGMRKINLQKDGEGITRIFFNNQPVFQIGTLDQGYWPDGLYTAPTDEALKFDIEYTKKLGFNMIRKHVKVEPARWYYWCDKIGILVWQDMPNITIGSNLTNSEKEQFETELIELVKEHYNHPSIISWVIFNENWVKHDISYLTDTVRSIDSTRIINSHSGWDVGGCDDKVGDINDKHEYPGPEMPELEDDRAAVCGEFGGLWRLIENHIWGTYVPNVGFQDQSSITDYYTGIFMDSIQVLKEKGMSAAVYTEITDVEIEYAGFLTYDRKVEKFNYFPVYLKHLQLTSPPNLIENEGSDPSGYRLKQNYPNPFNPETLIKYQLPENSFVDLTVYNTLGQKVINLVNMRQSAGTYTIEFDGENLSSGIYLYTLETNNFNQTNKMILLK